jgi:hypothetical protein
LSRTPSKRADKLSGINLDARRETRKSETRKNLLPVQQAMEVNALNFSDANLKSKRQKRSKGHTLRLALAVNTL